MKHPNHQQSHYPVAMRPKPGATLQTKRPPVAPPVYRPQPVPKVLQRKVDTKQRAWAVGQHHCSPVTKPPLRSQPAAVNLQAKMSAAPTVQKHKPAFSPGHNGRPVIQRLIVKIPSTTGIATLEHAVDQAEVNDTVEALKAKTGQTNNDVVEYKKNHPSAWAWDATGHNYIVSHGTAHGGNLNGVFPNELAKALVANGLTNQAGRLKVVACYALEDRVSKSFAMPFVESLRTEGGVNIKGLRVRSTRALVHYTPDRGKYLFSTYPQNLPDVLVVRDRDRAETASATSRAALRALKDYVGTKTDTDKPGHQDQKIINILKKVDPAFVTTQRDILKGPWAGIKARVNLVTALPDPAVGPIASNQEVFTTFHRHKLIELQQAGDEYWTRKKAALGAALNTKAPTPHKQGRKATSIVELENQRYEEYTV